MFSIADGRECFYQWDLNRQIRVSDSTISEVHFCNKTDECSLVVEVKANPTDSELYADVPNILLQNDFPIRVYAYCKDGYTKIEKIFKVITRTKPDDYVYTETEVKRWEDLANEIDAKIEKIDEVVEKVNAYDSSITENTKSITNLDKRLTNIEHHISDDYFSTVTLRGNKISVPSNACPNADIDKIGGYSTKVCTSKNLFKPTNAGCWDSSDISATVNGDNTIEVGAYYGAYGTIYINFNTNYIEGKRCSFTIEGLPGDLITDLYVWYAYYDEDGNMYDDTKVYPDGSFTFDTTGYASGDCYIEGYIENPTEEDIWGTLKIMINEGNALPFEPFAESFEAIKVTGIESKGRNGETLTSITVADEIQALDGYGLGVDNTNCNYIDFDRKVFVQNLYRRVFDGTENWQMVDAEVKTSGFPKKRMYLNISDKPAKSITNKTKSTLVCSMYNADTPENTYYCKDKTCAASNTSLWIYDISYSSEASLSSWKAYLARLYEQGTPLVVDYTLATPIATPIADFLPEDNTVEVVAGQYIKVLNEHNYPAPITMTYLLKEGSTDEEEVY